MKTPICVLRYTNILHITVGNAVQQVDILFAGVGHVGCVRAMKSTCGHKTLLSDYRFFSCICVPSLPLCLLCRSQVLARKSLGGDGHILKDTNA